MDQSPNWSVGAANGRESPLVAVARMLFAAAGFERIHIIGCSRSGTTMLHLAMGCFANVTLSQTETGARYPGPGERLKLALRHGWRPGKKYYITKRNYDWFDPRNVDALIAATRLENIGILHLVRDPRDVLLSRYVGSTRDASGQAYVSPEHWYKSIQAADHVFAALATNPRKLVLRYEDLVLDTGRAEAQLNAAFGLVPNPNAFPMDRVKDNFERLRIRFNRTTLRNLGGLRNMDSRSVGKWREKEGSIADTLSADIRARFEVFCDEHGYK